MQEKTFNRLLDERFDEIWEIRKKKNTLNIFKEIKNGDKTIQAAEKEQIKLKSKLDEITSRNPRHKSENQKDTIKNVKNLYESRQKVVGLFNDYSRIRSNVIYDTK